MSNATVAQAQCPALTQHGTALSPAGSALGPQKEARLKRQFWLSSFLCRFSGLIGAAREIRTPDPIITNDVLYQLSYCGPVA